MQVKFEEIIERANARKVAIEEFVEHLKGLADATAKLDTALTYFEDLSALSKELDAEAKSMLGRVPALAQLTNHVCEDARRRLFIDTSQNVPRVLLTLNVEASK